MMFTTSYKFSMRVAVARVAIWGRSSGDARRRAPAVRSSDSRDTSGHDRWRTFYVLYVPTMYSKWLPGSSGHVRVSIA